MIIMSRRSGRRAAVAAMAFGISLLSGAALAQPADHGIKAWQAEQVIKDFVTYFKSKAVITTSNNKVRVKISEVRRVYSKQFGWMVFADFQGAVVPDVYNDKQTQTYYHGMLRISADKNGVMQPMVINEGKGFWKETDTSSALHKRLSLVTGGWADWGGNPADVVRQPSTPTTGSVSSPQTPAGSPQGTGTKSSSTSGATQDQQKIMQEYFAAKKRYDDAVKNNTMTVEIQRKYNESYQKYQVMSGAKK
jgi:hypothetical protein